MTTYRACTTDLTIYATDENGETFDMNATGEPCRSVDDLVCFVNEMHALADFCDDATRDALLAQIAA